MNRFLAVLLAWSCAATATAQPPMAVLVVEEGNARSQAVGRMLEKELDRRVQLRRLSYSARGLEDPITRGKLLATLAAARLIVAIGNEPTALVLGELEDTPVYFVDASLVSGADLGRPEIGGLLSYSQEDVLRAIPGAWRVGLGLLYSPGYEPVVERIRASAREAGVKLLVGRVDRRKDLPLVAARLMDTAKSLWVLGDPILSRDAGFEFLAERSLAQGLPLVGSGPWEVHGGAVFCSQAGREALARKASERIVGLMEKGPGSGSRVDFAPSGGRLLFHRRLAERFGLSPKAPDWEEAP